MDLNFQPIRGNAFTIEVGYFDTVLEMKEKIQKEKGIPVSKQTLVFNGNILPDELNVHYSDILDRSCIHLHVASELDNNPQIKIEEFSQIQLLLKMPASKLGIPIEINVNSTIQKVKEKIHEMEGIPIIQLAIHVNGIELYDHKTIHDYELVDNSELNVVVRSSPVRTSSRSSSANTNGSTKLKVFVLTKGIVEKIPMEVNCLDNVGELKKKLEKLKLDLPTEGYFFIFKQNVMDDDRSFRWHHVCQGDIIEIFGGSVSGGT